MRLGIVELYCGKSGKKGYYNNQEIGLARAMKKRGYDSVIFYPSADESGCREEVVEDQITIVYVSAKAIGNHARYDWNILLKYHIDVVQVGSDNQIFAPNLIRFCDINGIKLYNFIGTVQSDTDNHLKKQIMRILFSRNVRMLKNHKCFVKTQKVYDELTALGIQNATIAPVGLDLSIIPQVTEPSEELRKRLDLPADKQILLFVGRLDSYKRPMEALEMFAGLPDSNYMVMIGNGELDGQADAYIEKNGLTDRVRRIKKIPNAQIHTFYKAADYYLNFNEKEIFGLSVLEAMYQDCTVIAVGAPGPKEMIRNGENGFLVASAQEMKDLLAQKVALEPGAARESVVSRFVWDKTAEKFDTWIRAC